MICTLNTSPAEFVDIIIREMDCHRDRLDYFDILDDRIDEIVPEELQDEVRTVIYTRTFRAA